MSDPTSTTEETNGNVNGSPSDEEMRKKLKPDISDEQVLEVIRKSFAVDEEEIKISRHLDSYDDENFKVALAGTPFLLKIHNGVESEEFIKVYEEEAGEDFFKPGCMHSTIHLQSTIMDLLSSHNINTSKPSLAADTLCPVAIHTLPVVSKSHSPRRLVVRLFKWVEGRLMSDVKILPLEALADAGRYLGRIDKVLDKLSLAKMKAAEQGPPECNDAKLRLSGWVNFDYKDGVKADSSVLKAAKRFHQWDGKNTAQLRPFIHNILDEKRRKIVLSILDAFQSEIIDSGDAQQFRCGVNHGDFNDANIVVNGDFFVSGVIDFGDSVESWRVLDISVAMAYGMLSTYGKANRSISAAAAMLRGFNSIYPLTAVERKHLVLLVMCRLACSVTLGAYSYRLNPENKYLLFHAEPAWKVLEMVWCHDCEQRGSVAKAFNRVLEQACLHHQPSNSDMIACSDLVIPDPTVVDLLAGVRLPAFELVEPPTKKLKTSHEGLPVITFVTGNKKKLEEVQRILKFDSDDSDENKLPFRLTNMKIDLPELQGDPISIAKEKCALAAKKVGGAVITEDTSLCFNALKGMPGPYIKWFLDACGHEGLNKMIDAYEDKSAYAMTVVGFCAGPGKEAAVFCGKTVGKIVMPRGPNAFGWDPIFQPDEGEGKTYAEMSKDEKDRISHRGRALVQMRAFFECQRETLRHEIV